MCGGGEDVDGVGVGAIHDLVQFIRGDTLPGRAFKALDKGLVGLGDKAYQLRATEESALEGEHDAPPFPGQQPRKAAGVLGDDACFLGALVHHVA